MIIQNTGEYTYNIGVRLIPGGNQIKDSDVKAFQEAAKLPLNKSLIEQGVIELPEGFESEVADNISEINPWQKAVDLVKDTYDLAVLEGYLEDEKAASNRNSVITAITEQIEQIKNPAEDKQVER
ncbi:hypothetical protein [Listeria ilorinensis]|uniref:hypothetical protein n=1 Tax=Listeria ilorinensis TaxID=2867439 RepID=UPI001EF577A3|nr:hypothetical protein [Listeria ilorinensis]